MLLFSRKVIKNRGTFTPTMPVVSPPPHLQPFLVLMVDIERLGRGSIHQILPQPSRPFHLLLGWCTPLTNLDNGAFGRHQNSSFVPSCFVSGICSRCFHVEVVDSSLSGLSLCMLHLWSISDWSLAILTKRSYQSLFQRQTNYHLPPEN